MRILGFKVPSVRDAERGFTIVEAAIVITVILIVLAITVPGYRYVILKSKEETLREDLRVMRKMIDQFAADKERAPASLEELVEARYLPEIPVDPLTGSADTWEVIMEEEPMSRAGERGISDVKSGSQEYDSSGERRYSDW
jgi:general secretion pathway protein G